MNKRTLLWLLRKADDDTELYVNIFNEKECLPDSIVFGGKSHIKGVSRVGDKFAIDIKIGEAENRMEKENAELKNRNQELLESCEGAAMMYKDLSKVKEQLTKAKEIIKDYMIVVKGDNVTVCGVPEENRCINVLKLNEQAEQFLKESE